MAAKRTSTRPASGKRAPSAARRATADLHAPGRILLVSCYELGHQPHGITLPMAFLERAGFRPASLDLAVEAFDAQRVAAAGLVAIATPMHTALRLGVQLAARVHALNPTAIIGYHGHYAHLHATSLRAAGAAFILGGECEAALVGIAEQLDRGEPLDVDLRGPLYDKLDFPTPSRAALPSMAHYAHLEMETAPGKLQRLPAGYVETTRGCRHQCRHCPIPAVYGGRIFVVPLGTIQDDVRKQVAAGAAHITFGDADFLNAPTHALRVIRALHTEFPDLGFDFTAKVEHLLRYHDVLPELAASGTRFVVSAFESLCDTVLANLDKGHRGADVVAVTRLLRRFGLAVRPSWLPFTPWSTLDDFRNLLEFVDSEDLVHHVDPVQYGIRLLLPEGSLLLRRPEVLGPVGAFDRERLTYNWSHADARVDALHDAVARLVAQAVADEEPVETTFARLWDLAIQGAGAAPRATPARPRSLRPPRLTESWFC